MKTRKYKLTQTRLFFVDSIVTVLKFTFWFDKIFNFVSHFFLDPSRLIGGSRSIDSKIRSTLINPRFIFFWINRSSARFQDRAIHGDQSGSPRSIDAQHKAQKVVVVRRKAKKTKKNTLSFWRIFFIYYMATSIWNLNRHSLGSKTVDLLKKTWKKPTKNTIFL